MFEGKHTILRNLFIDQCVPFVLIGSTVQALSNVNNYISGIQQFSCSFLKYTKFYYNNFSGLCLNNNHFYGLLTSNVTALTFANVGCIILILVIVLVCCFRLIQMNVVIVLYRLYVIRVLMEIKLLK